MLLKPAAEFRLQYDAELSLMRLGWVPGVANTHYRAATDQMLDLAEQFQARHYLVDMSDVPDISVYDQLWLGRHWVPRAMRLPTVRVVYCNRPERLHNQLAIESLLYLAKPFIRFDVQFFSETEAALDWLTDGSPRLPELLAEWEASFSPGTGPATDSLPSPSGVAEPPAPYRRGILS